QLALTICLPSGLKATAEILSVCPLNAKVSVPVLASHTFNVWSQLALTMRWPSGLYDTPLTLVACPLRERSSAPESASHTLSSPAAPSPGGRLPLPLTMRLPSGL